MAITTRVITGPIETPEHEVVEQGFLRVNLLYPIVDGTTMVAPFKLEFRIVDGEPVDCALSAPGWYDIRIFDTIEEKVWSFQANLYPNGGSAISVAELWQLALLEDGSLIPNDPERLDASVLGSNGATGGYVLTADGDGGTDWLPVGALTPGDMTKAVYDSDDDGIVEEADYAATSGLAADATLFGGLSPSSYQEALAGAVSEGAILTWDDTLEQYTPNENFLVDASGNVVSGGIRLIGALYGNVFVMNQVYYLIDDETHVVVVKEDDVELRLPNAALQAGRVIEIKKASSDGFTVLITSVGGQIDGNTTYELVYQYEALTLVAADDNWYIY